MKRHEAIVWWSWSESLVHFSAQFPLMYSEKRKREEKKKKKTRPGNNEKGFYNYSDVSLLLRLIK